MTKDTSTNEIRLKFFESRNTNLIKVACCDHIVDGEAIDLNHLLNDCKVWAQNHIKGVPTYLTILASVDVLIY